MPRPVPFEQAVRLFRAAELEECLAGLRRNDSIEAHVLRGRALMRLGRNRDAVAALQAGARLAQVDGSAHARGEVAMLMAAAYHRAGCPVDAAEYFSAARAYVWSTSDADLHAELARHVATMHWADDNVDLAESLARKALDARSPLQKALALELVGAIEANRGHLHTQAACLEEALEYFEGPDCFDVWVETAILRNLAILASDLQLPDVPAKLERRADAIPWTDETSPRRHDLLRNLAWCAAVRGDHLKAFRMLRQSAEHAPSAARRLFCFLDRSFLAREMGEQLFASAEFESAEQIASTVDWDHTDGDERYALLLLAELIAPSDGERAQVILHRYRSIKRKMSVLVAQHDGQLRALEAHAYGIVAAATHDRGRAADLLNEAFSIWRSIGFVWRATRTALEMADLLGDRRHVPFARERAADYPNAWFSRSPSLTAPAVAEPPLKFARA